MIEGFDNVVADELFASVPEVAIGKKKDETSEKKSIIWYNGNFLLIQYY